MKDIFGPLNDMAREAHAVALAHGWYDGTQPRGLAEFVANVHGEASEVWEEARKGHPPQLTYLRADGKPEGIPTELADILLRVFDTAHKEGIDLAAAVARKHEYNKSRPYRHGGKVA